jgi:hypothetical protein
MSRIHPQVHSFTAFPPCKTSCCIKSHMLYEPCNEPKILHSMEFGIILSMFAALGGRRSSGSCSGGRGRLRAAECGSSIKEALVTHVAAGSPLRWLRRLSCCSSSLSGTESLETLLSLENPRDTYRQAIMLQRQLISGQSREEVMCGHMHYIEAMRFVRCAALGLLLITASWDHDVRIFQCASSKCIGRLCGHEGWVICLDVSGGWLVTGGMDGFLCTWHLDPALLTHGQEAMMQRPTVQLQHASEVTACCWLNAGMFQPAQC